MCVSSSSTSLLSTSLVHAHHTFIYIPQLPNKYITSCELSFLSIHIHVPHLPSPSSFQQNHKQKHSWKIFFLTYVMCHIWSSVAPWLLWHLIMLFSEMSEYENICQNDFHFKMNCVSNLSLATIISLSSFKMRFSLTKILGLMVSSMNLIMLFVWWNLLNVGGEVIYKDIVDDAKHGQKIPSV
jgi:hypothetical protein